MSVTADIVNTLFDGLDALESYLQNICSSGDEGTEENAEIISKLDTFMKQGIGEAPVAKAEVSKTEAKQEVSQNDVAKEKFRNFKFVDYEAHAMEEALASGQHVYGATVYIQESCLLKAARAFLVFKTLDGMGTIIKSEPEVQDIEDEKFEYDFSLILLTKESIAEVKKAIMDVSEVDKAYISEIQKEEFIVPEVKEVVEEKKKEETPVVEASTPATPASATPAQAVKEKEQKKQPAQSGKPVVNRSVRVDIDKLDDLMNLVSELIIAKNGLVSSNNADDMTRQSKSGFVEQIEYLERITTNLHTSVMKVRMVPLESVVNRFPRMIRDLSKKLNKKMELTIIGVRQS